MKAIKEGTSISFDLQSKKGQAFLLICLFKRPNNDQAFFWVRDSLTFGSSVFSPDFHVSRTAVALFMVNGQWFNSVQTIFNQTRSWLLLRYTQCWSCFYFHFNFNWFWWIQLFLFIDSLSYLSSYLLFARYTSILGYLCSCDS